MKYGKSKDGGFIHNCVLVKRKTDKDKSLFCCSNERTTAHLNGYAIIPIEEYAQLKGETVDLDAVTAAEEALCT